MRGKLIGVLALFALFGCVNARPVSMEVRADEYLKWVHDDRLTVMETLWTDERLLDEANGVCAEMDRTGGDGTALLYKMAQGLSTELSEAEFALLSNDQNVVITGAVTFICPEWADSLGN